MLHACVRGLSSTTASLDSSCYSQALGVNLPFPSGPSLRFLVQGEGGDPGTESCPSGFVEGLPGDSHHLLCGLPCSMHASALLPACVCVHASVHASPLMPLWLRALGPPLACPGAPPFSRPLFSHRFYTHSHSHQIPHGPETPRLQGVL